MDSVIDLLEDDTVDEEDKPDALKALLSSILSQSEAVRTNDRGKCDLEELTSRMSNSLTWTR